METPDFGAPTEAVPPETRVGHKSDYWKIVAEHAKGNPGQWIPLITKLSRTRLSNVALAMAHPGTSDSNIPVCFREIGFKTHYARGTLYFRYDPPALRSVPAKGQPNWENEYKAQ